MYLTIGSDPEIALATVKVLTKRKEEIGKFVNAAEFIPSSGGKFGRDGCSYIAEIRPDPSDNPLDHAENIRKVLAEYRKKYKKVYDLGMFGWSTRDIGGHIHFGAKGIGSKKEAVTYALDSYLSTIYTFVEKPDIYRKRHTNYGRLSNVRSAYWGEGLEYRTISSWMASDKLARAVLCTAYSIVYDVMQDRFTGTLFSRYDGFSDSYANFHLDLLRPFRNKAVAQVRQLSLYKTYKEHIDYLLYHAMHENYITLGEIKKGWKIPYTEVRQQMIKTMLQLVRLFLSEVKKGERYAAPGSDGEGNIYPVVTHREGDYEIAPILRRVNGAIYTILSSSTQIGNNVRIHGLSAKRGNLITIYCHRGVDSNRIERLSRILGDVIRALGAEDVKLQIVKVQDVPFNFEFALGLGRPVRERTDYLAEIVTFITLLYANRSVYRAYKHMRETGDEVNLKLLCRMLAKEKNSIKKVKKNNKILDTEDILEEATTLGYIGGFNADHQRLSFFDYEHLKIAVNTARGTTISETELTIGHDRNVLMGQYEALRASVALRDRHPLTEGTF